MMKKKFLIKINILAFLIIFICSSGTLGSLTYSKLADELMDINEIGLKYIGVYNCSCEDIINDFKSNSVVEKIEKGKNYITLIGKMNNINYEAGIRDDKTKEVVVELNKITDKKEIGIIKKQLEKLTNDKCKEKRYFTYIKGKINKDTDKETEKLTDVFKQHGADNIRTIPINSGYAGIADIGLFRINYAVCRYDSGTYMVLGTPDIFITY